MTNERVTAAIMTRLARPAGLHDIAQAGFVPVAVAARLLMRWYETGAVVVCHRDAFLDRVHWAGFLTQVPPIEASGSHRVVSALGDEHRGLTEISAACGLPEAEVASELRLLVRLGIAKSSVVGRCDLGWRRLAVPSGGPRRAVNAMVGQALVLELMASPTAITHVAALLGWKRSRAKDCVHLLVASGRARPAPGRLFVAIPATGTASAMPLPPPAAQLPGQPAQIRPGLVRDAIMACLDQPRRPLEIAASIGRNIPNVTGHLRAMMARGMVRRIGVGLYAQATADPAPARRRRGRASAGRASTPPSTA